MKTKVNVLVFAFVIFVSAAFAESPASMAILANATKGIYKVCYMAQQTGKVKLSIYNEKNEMIYTEAMANVSSFIRPYNFNQLPEGEYTIVLEDKAGKQVEKISYQHDKVENVISVSKMAGVDNKFLLSISNNGTDVIDVKIYNEANVLLHTQTETVSGNFNLVYNLQQVMFNGAKITFQVTTGSGKTETITY